MVTTSVFSTPSPATPISYCPPDMGSCADKVKTTYKLIAFVLDFFIAIAFECFHYSSQEYLEILD